MHTLTLEKATLRDFSLVLLASFLICLTGQIAIPLWFTPVPLITQNSAVLLAAVLLGARRGSAATFAFLAQGIMGLPVFSNGGCGIHHLAGPTGGYLIGYLIASYAAGYIAEKKRTLGNALKAFTIGSLIIYACGSSYLATFIGWEKALLLGVAPFVLGDLFKTIASLKLLQTAGWTQPK